MTAEPTILVVDDSMTIRAVVRQLLEEKSYTVVEAADGPAAIAYCLQAPPDVVVLDIEMPGLNGYEVLARLKGEPILQNIPVVFLTTLSGPDQILRGLEGGAHDFVNKTFLTNDTGPLELAARVGSAARVKRLQDELSTRNLELDTLSRTDLLTGLFNRRHLQEELPRHVSTAQRHSESVGVILLDIDHFKHVNDTYGHQAGDAVLCEFASRILSTLRDGDIAGRWGGEEFLVILPRTELAGATEAGERVRAAIAAKPFLVNELIIPVTVSGGCAVGPGASAQDLVHRADTGLYEAKDTGRNRIVAAVAALDPFI